MYGLKIVLIGERIFTITLVILCRRRQSNAQTLTRTRTNHKYIMSEMLVYSFHPFSRNHDRWMQLAPSFNKSRTSSTDVRMGLPLTRQTSIFNGLNYTKQNVNILIFDHLLFNLRFHAVGSRIESNGYWKRDGPKCEPKYTFSEIPWHRQVHCFLKRKSGICEIEEHILNKQRSKEWKMNWKNERASRTGVSRIFKIETKKKKIWNENRYLVCSLAIADIVSLFICLNS